MNTELLKRVVITFSGLIVGFLIGWLVIRIVTSSIENVARDDSALPVSGIDIGADFPLDTARYEEIRYVNARHFTSSQLYGLHCKLCHGVDGSGTGPVTRYDNGLCPADLTKHVNRTDQHVYYVILNGTEHMPDATKPVSKHVLTDDDIWMIVYHVKTLQKDE